MRWRKPTARIGASMLNDCAHVARWEHFQRGADIGIRGIGPTKPQAFEQAALPLTAIDINRGSADGEFFSWTGYLH